MRLIKLFLIIALVCIGGALIVVGSTYIGSVFIFIGIIFGIFSKWTMPFEIDSDSECRDSKRYDQESFCRHASEYVAEEGSTSAKITTTTPTTATTS
jgi:hypothetical protein